MQSLRNQSATIVMRKGIRLGGTVTDLNGDAVRKAVVIHGDDPYFQTGSQEVLTNEQGVYKLPPLPPGEVAITVVAKGWSPEMRRVKLTHGMGKVDFPLRRGTELRLKFVDKKGLPIPKVYVGIRSWRGRKSLYNTRHPNVITTHIPQMSNKRGIFVWKWAPTDAVTYEFARRGIADKEIEVTADGKLQTITLDTVLTVSGSVTDAKTSKPIQRFKVSPVIYFSPEFLVVNRRDAVAGRGGQFKIQFDRMDIEHGIRIEAPGYRTRAFGSWPIGDQNPMLDVRLEPAPLVRALC